MDLIQNGLVGHGLVRDTLWPFGEYVPEIDEEFTIPCEELDPDTKDYFVQFQLSCLAKKHKIYVVAGMVDVQPCNECGENRFVYIFVIDNGIDFRFFQMYVQYSCCL